RVEGAKNHNILLTEEGKTSWHDFTPLDFGRIEVERREVEPAGLPLDGTKDVMVPTRGRPAGTTSRRSTSERSCSAPRWPMARDVRSVTSGPSWTKRGSRRRGLPDSCQVGSARLARSDARASRRSAGDCRARYVTDCWL